MENGPRPRGPDLRGTGKTHLLRHLHDRRTADGALSAYRWSPMLGEISDALDALVAAATQIRVVGETEVEQHHEISNRFSRNASLEIGFAPDPRATWRADATTDRSRRKAERRLDRGQEAHHVLSWTPAPFWD